MRNNNTRQAVMFNGLSKKPVVTRFDQEYGSSDGGALLLKACDERLGLSAELAACLHDGRQQWKVVHSLQELLQQRLFSIACGYADANDASQLSEDPVFKLLLDRDPIVGEGLASQPTVSRFENGVTAGELLRLSEALADCVIKRHKKRKKRVRRITIDLDPTDDLTYGAQQLSLFNNYYGGWCYLPMAGFLSFDDEPNQYLFCYVLRHGRAPAKAGCLSILKRLLPRLRAAFANVKIRIRLDSAFAVPELFDYFEAEQLEYVVAMGKNVRLEAYAEEDMVAVRAEVEAQGGSCHRFGECLYQAHRWRHPRRTIYKAEVTCLDGHEPKENPRFVVTNLKSSPRWIYKRIYCARGDVENRIKELKCALEIDRTSCTSFAANQLRVLVTAAAYVLMQELRLHARGTRFARAQVETLRLHLLKFGAWFESSVRRLTVHFPISTRYADEWRRIARSVGAVTT